MKNLKILYLRKNNVYDGLMDKAINLINKKMEIEYDDITQFEKYLCDSDSKDSRFYDILIIYGKDKEEILEYADRLPAMSIVCLYDKEVEEKEPVWVGSKLFEEYSIIGFDKPVFCLSRLIIRNSFFLEELHKCQALSNAVIKLVPDGLIVFDIEGIVLNSSNAHVSGYSANELIGKSIFSFMEEAECLHVKKIMKEALSNGGDVNQRIKIVRKDGTILPFDVSASLIHDHRGSPAYFLAILSDITVKKEAERTRFFLRHLIESSREGILAADKDLRITMWNKGGEEILGYTPKDVLGKLIGMFCPDEETKDKQRQYIEQVKKEGYIKNYIAPRKCKDGRIKYIDHTITALYDDEGEFGGISVIFQDLSEMEITLKEAQKKNEEMEHLINVVSHDLRSPLHSIDNYISLIRESVENTVRDEKILEMFERIHVNVINMESLIRDLTEFSRAGITSKDGIAVDLDSIVSEIVRNIQWQMGRQNFIVKMDRLPVININPGRIHQVFENILTNAGKFCVEGEPVRVEIKVKRHNDIIRFSVRDHGIGIDREHHDKIFNLFYRTKEKQIEGSGAGLAITRKIIRSYGGEIWFESEKNKGTTFYFTLPSSRIVEE